MQNRKSFEADLENKKGLFLQIGIVLALAIIWGAFEYKSYNEEVNSLGQNEAFIDDEEVIMSLRETPPPPPPPPAPPEVITIVEDDKVDIKEINPLESEIDDDDEFPLMEIQDDGQVYTFDVVTNKPIWPGCERIADDSARFYCFNLEIRKFVVKEFEYPELSKQMNIGGKVYVSFVIEKDGKISNVEIARGVEKLIDAEAIRVVKKLPKVTPAKISGRPVRLSYVLPISVSLQ